MSFLKSFYGKYSSHSRSQRLSSTPPSYFHVCRCQGLETQPGVHHLQNMSTLIPKLSKPQQKLAKLSLPYGMIHTVMFNHFDVLFTVLLLSSPTLSVPRLSNIWVCPPSYLILIRPCPYFPPPEPSTTPHSPSLPSLSIDLPDFDLFSDEKVNLETLMSL